MRHVFPFAFAVILAAGTALQAAPRKADAPERTADARDKVVCKSFVRTGSLVDGYRICKTKADWERERENIRALSTTDSCRGRAEGGPC